MGVKDAAAVCKSPSSEEMLHFFFSKCLFFRTIASLDYEIFSEFLFQVYVRDSGQPPRSADSPADVVIKVSPATSDALWIIYDSDGFYVPALC